MRRETQSRLRSIEAAAPKTDEHTPNQLLSAPAAAPSFDTDGLCLLAVAGSFLGHDFFVRFPTPDDMAQAPAWDNYVVAQASAATLRQIPRTAAGIGVAIQREQVTLHFCLHSVDEETRCDMADIADDLGMLLGDGASVGVAYEITDDFRINPHDRIRWVFAERADDAV